MHDIYASVLLLYSAKFLRAVNFVDFIVSLQNANYVAKLFVSTTVKCSAFIFNIKCW